VVVPVGKVVVEVKDVEVGVGTIIEEDGEAGVTIATLTGVRTVGNKFKD